MILSTQQSSFASLANSILYHILLYITVITLYDLKMFLGPKLVVEVATRKEGCCVDGIIVNLVT
jgi:hypothetical protein